MKRVMPFVQASKEKVESAGISALNLTFDFNEYDVLERNKKYLQNTLEVISQLQILFITLLKIQFYYFYVLYLCDLLYIFQLSEIIIKYTDEAPEKTKEECCPGSPYINFIVKPSVPLSLINPQKYVGLFRMNLKIYEDDTVSNLIKRILHEHKHIKGLQY